MKETFRTSCCCEGEEGGKGACYCWMAGDVSWRQTIVVPLYDLQALAVTTLYAARLSLFDYCMREVNGILRTDDHSAC